MSYSIGIDLGTTHSILAYRKLEDEKAPVELLAIPQLISPSTLEDRPSLPSFLYLAPPQENPTLSLPWAKTRDYAVGAMAYKQAAEVPTRTIAAAKSWLGYNRVDRHEPILPWGAPAEVAKISPVEASRRYLEHLAAAWTAKFPKHPLAKQRVVLTVPASFDAGARDLTRQAALAAGLPEDLIMLEEPQAALYAWLENQGQKWRRDLQLNDTLLVCDVGGGTSDFTLIRVIEEAGALSLERIAVGNHTLVGGDNMDLALAHLARTAFAAKGHDLNAWQSVALWHSCRVAKEQLLSSDGPAKHPVTVLGRGSRLVGGTVSVELEKGAVSDLLLEGFFPLCALADKPQRKKASGFRELGLPYESDTAITRHLADFLQVHAGGLRPTHLLFNGGVFKAPALQNRLLEVLGSWFGQPPHLLAGRQDLDFSVARGAAFYGSIRGTQAVRIRGGTARSYYLGIETAGLAIPGMPRPLEALCVVPFGMEEGTSLPIASGEFGLVVGEAAKFRFFSSATRKSDKPGEMLKHWSDQELQETDSMEATLPAGSDGGEEFVPVRFESRITELGVFELWCVSSQKNQRWKLEFSVRDNES